MVVTRSRQSRSKAASTPAMSSSKTRQAGPSSRLEQRMSEAAALGGGGAGKKTEPPTRQKSQLDRKLSARLKRVRSGSLNLNKELSIQMSKKTKAKKVDVRRRRLVWDWVYVGNVDPSVTHDQMKNLFGQCGSISRIQFRCSGGRGVTVGVAIDSSLQTPRDRLYVSIEFSKASSVRHALKLNGTMLNGCKLLVTIAPADLPEVQDIVEAREAELARRGQLAKLGVKKLVKRVAWYPTEMIVPKESRRGLIPPPPKDRHVMFGFSFAKTVL